MRIIENNEPQTLGEPEVEPKEEPRKPEKDPYQCFSDSLEEIARDLNDLSFKVNKISAAILSFGKHEN